MSRSQIRSGNSPVFLTGGEVAGNTGIRGNESIGGLVFFADEGEVSLEDTFIIYLYDERKKPGSFSLSVFSTSQVDEIGRFPVLPGMKQIIPDEITREEAIKLPATATVQATISEVTLKEETIGIAIGGIWLPIVILLEDITIVK
ncbi:MAG: hypothetical protein P8M30_00010 [Planctomycetaceae bacterium]|nr:hypothetical protein [Planctomycetaceae bacterium]